MDICPLNKEEKKENTVRKFQKLTYLTDDPTVNF